MVKASNFPVPGPGVRQLFHWYLDGAYLGPTDSPERAFVLGDRDQARVEVVDSTDPSFDPIANAPEAYPARRTVEFVRSLDTSVARYIAKTQDFTDIVETIFADVPSSGAWSYRVMTRRLPDLNEIAEVVVPVDAAGNLGTSQTTQVKKNVRRPDAPNFTISYDSGTGQTTVSAA